jgi:hypothetical protein
MAGGEKTDDLIRTPMEKRKKKKRLASKTFFLMGTFVAVVLVMTPGARAENSSGNQKVGIAVDRSVFSFDLLPGAEREFSVTVRNTSDASERMLVSMRDFSLEDDNRINLADDQSENPTLSKWISSSETAWTLEAGKSKEIAVKIAVPEDASVGSHHAAVIIQALPENADPTKGSVASGQVGISVLANIAGDVSGKGKLDAFDAPFFAFRQITLRAEFENTGNVHYIPHGEISLRNILSGSVRKAEFEKHFVFPERKHSFTADMDVPSPFGIYSARVSFVDADGNVSSASRPVLGALFIPTAVAVVALVVEMIILYRRKRETVSPS